MRSTASYTPAAAVTSEHMNTRFQGQEIAMESRGKPIPVVVGGSDLGGNRMALAQTAAQALQSGNWSEPVNFVPASGLTAAANNESGEGDTNLSPYSVMVMVNGPRDITAADLCANPALANTSALTDSTTPRNVHVITALCRYDTLVSQSEGVSANVSGANDPALHNLIASAANDMTGPTSISPTHSEEL